jgi:type IX secretion system PorP/SprF family membrane protein
MRKLVGFLIGIILSLNSIQGQDFTFSNHNLVPFNLNPSLVGNANAPRVGVNYRMQWPTLGNNYHTIRASYDQNFYKQMSSFGAAFSHDNMANGVYRINEVDLIYGHTVRLDEFYFLRLGVQASVFANYLDWGKLTFGDQYDPYLREILPNSVENSDMESRVFMDFSFGATFVITNLLTVGASVYHIGEPDNGFARKEDNSLKRKYVFHANFMKDLQYNNGLFGRRDVSDNFLFVNASYQQQEDFRLAHLGVGISISPLLAGVYAKSNIENIDEIHTLSFMLGGQFKGLQLYYIYDLFTSNKKNGSWSHEISLIYIFRKDEKFPCPVTYW